MFTEAKRHSIERIRGAEVRLLPFPHIFVEEIFPASFYAEMQQRKLEDQRYRRLVDTGRVGNLYSPARLCLMEPDIEASSHDENAAFWKQVFETFNTSELAQAFLETFHTQIQERLRLKEVPPGISGKNIPLRHEIFLMRDLMAYGLPPHTDTPEKVVSALFYLPPDNAKAHLGTTLYKPKEDALRDNGKDHLEWDAFDVAGRAPYLANALFAFPKTSVCFHGVEPIAESYRRDVMLFDIKFKR